MPRGWAATPAGPGCSALGHPSAGQPSVGTPRDPLRAWSRTPGNLGTAEPGCGSEAGDGLRGKGGGGNRRSPGSARLCGRRRPGCPPSPTPSLPAADAETVRKMGASPRSSARSLSHRVLGGAGLPRRQAAARWLAGRPAAAPHIPPSEDGQPARPSPGPGIIPGSTKSSLAKFHQHRSEILT